MATAIEFNNISKLYRLGTVSTGTLAHDLKRWWTVNVRRKEDPYLRIGETNDRSTKGESEYVWALKDIDFKVEQGDVVGIIGKNGAGKSTLLKLLSRVTAPTTGSIKARGRIGSLLEVGTGFHPEMTGRENIYMNGAILGMTKAEITKKLDEIVDFSGCERYIDTPVKRYSSGMMVRLGFAVAAHLDPEILVVDEVLAVGDAEFQKKAIGKMQDVSKGEGRTVLFVSHNTKSVRRLCTKGMLLENGRLSYSADIDSVIERYLSVYQNTDGLIGQSVFEHDGSKSHQYEEVRFEDAEGKVINAPIDVDQELYLYMRYRAERPMNAHMAFYFSNMQEEIVWYNERADYYGGYVDLPRGTFESKIRLPNPFLKPGRYYLTIGFRDESTKVNDLRKDILSIEIGDTKVFRTGDRAGDIYLPVVWAVNQVG